MSRISRTTKALRMTQIALTSHQGGADNALSRFWVAKNYYIVALRATCSGSPMDLLSYERRFMDTIDAAWEQFVIIYPMMK